MRVIIYVRVSTQEQAKEGYSIQEQIERLQKYCEAMGWTIYKIYTDPGYTGATMDRPALSQLIRDVKAGRADKVLVYKLDRLSRSQLDTLYLIDKVFLANNTDFVSMNENFDTSTPFGRAMIGILAVFAQLEREQIKERMMMGKEARAKEGKFAGSWAVPIGYDYIPEKDMLEINEYERMQVLDIFDMFFSGVPIKRMEKICMEKGFKHKHGTWNDKTIRNVMRSKTYLGMLKFRGDWVQGLHDPIISQATHEKAVRMLDERKEAYEKNRRPGKVQSYLGGLLVCKRCGAKYSKKRGYKPKNGDRISYYYCNSRSKQSPKLVKDPNCKNNNWRMEILDNAVFDEIRKLGTDPAYFDTVIEEKKENNRPEIIRAEIERLDSQIGKLMDLYTVGNMPLDVIQGKIHEINDQKGSLENELEAIKREEQAALSRAETMEIVGSFGEVLESGDFHRIRAVVETLVDYVELDGDKVDIHWNFV